MLKNIKYFKLYILCMDDETYEILLRLKLKNVVLINLFDFEEEDLIKIKFGRSVAEYCWTCTPALLLYILKEFQEAIITYLDADLYFFSDPSPIFDEFGNNSILITEHNFTPKYDQADISGKYNVQFITIRNDLNGIACLEWWKKKCLEWCFARLEDGKYGDQRYLEQWPDLFKGTYVLKHPGSGIAPWNVNNYQNFDNIIFYHFHGLSMYKDSFDICRGYNINDNVKEIIYLPYLNKLRNAEKKLLSYDFDIRDIYVKKNMLKDFYLKVKYSIYSNNNTIKFDNIFGIKIRI